MALRSRHRTRSVAGLDPGAGAGTPGVEIRRIERTEADADLGRAVRVAPRHAKVGNRIQIRAGIDQHPLVGGHLPGLQQRVLVVRLDLEDLLVERAPAFGKNPSRLRLSAMRANCSTALSLCPARTYRSPSMFAVFQSCG